MAISKVMDRPTPGEVSIFLSYSRRPSSKRAAVGVIMVRNGRIFEKAVEVPYDSIGSTLDSSVTAAVLAQGMLLPGESAIIYVRDYIFQKIIGGNLWRNWALNGWKTKRAEHPRNLPMWKMYAEGCNKNKIRVGRMPQLDQTMIWHIHRMKVVPSIPIFTRKDYESTYDITVLAGREPTIYTADD